jgi:transcriptional regulator with XRE-family HTH domain
MGRRQRNITIANSTLLPRLSRQLLRVLDAQSLSIQQLSIRTGLSKSFLRAVARAEQNLSVLMMEEIAQALDLSVEQLLLYQSIPEPEGDVPMLKVRRRRQTSIAGR